MFISFLRNWYQLDEDEENTAKFEPLLACLFAWKHEADVVKLIRGWIESGLGKGEDTVTTNSKTTNKKKKKTAKKKTTTTKKGKAVRGGKKAAAAAAKKSGRRGAKKLRDDSDEDENESEQLDEDDVDASGRHVSAGKGKPFVALRLLSSIMEKDAMREKLLRRYDLAVGIMDAFEAYLTLIENRFDGTAEEDEDLTDDILFRVMDCFTRFLIHAIGSDDPQWRQKGDEVLGRLLTWTNDILLPVIQSDTGDGELDESLANAFAFIDKVPFAVFPLTDRFTSLSHHQLLFIYLLFPSPVSEARGGDHYGAGGLWSLRQSEHQTGGGPHQGSPFRQTYALNRSIFRPLKSSWPLKILHRTGIRATQASPSLSRWPSPSPAVCSISSTTRAPTR